jgi:hypothetical protein
MRIVDDIRRIEQMVRDAYLVHVPSSLAILASKL